MPRTRLRYLAPSPSPTMTLVCADNDSVSAGKQNNDGGYSVLFVDPASPSPDASHVTFILEIQSIPYYQKTMADSCYFQMTVLVLVLLL
jgi:hypothetical protein